MTRRNGDVTTVTASPRAQLASFIAKYAPAIAADGRVALTKLRRLLPGAVELVYDNYQWLVVGFGPSERPSDAVLSLVFAPRWLFVCFLQNASKLPDPKRLLRGSGTQVRNVRLDSARDLDREDVRALIAAALTRARVPIARRNRRRLVIRAISARQHPRRPA
jgi:hypothetical protein